MVKPKSPRAVPLALALSLALPTVSFAMQPSAAPPIPAPLRDLPWSPQINFLHTTDTHGWHAGHLKEHVRPLRMIEYYANLRLP